MTDPKLFPVMMVYNRRGWKVQISLPAMTFDDKKKPKPFTQFICAINGIAYDDYTYKFIDPDDKKNRIIKIAGGTIYSGLKLNGKQML